VSSKNWTKLGRFFSLGLRQHIPQSVIDRIASDLQQRRLRNRTGVTLDLLKQIDDGHPAEVKLPVVQKALEIATLMLGSYRSR
jgi:hypothetical protein